MALHAVEDLEDAFVATRAFLLPLDIGRWLRLAVVAFFVGGAGASVPTSGVEFRGESLGPGRVATVLPDATGRVLALALLVGGILAALGLAFGFVGSVMEFVLVASLREGRVEIRGHAREHWRAGARLFGFRLALSLLAAALVVLPVLALVFQAGGPGAIDGPGAVAGLALVAVPLAFLAGTLYALVGGFTTFFVVPVMLLQGRGVLASWRRFYGTLRASWREYLVFALLTLVLTSLAATAVGTVVGALALVVLGPFVLLGLAGVVTAGAFGPGVLDAAALPVLLALGAAGLLAVLLVLFLVALVRVPVVTYLRYYALLVLGDTDGDLDLVRERRRAVRAGDDGDGKASGGTSTDAGSTGEESTGGESGPESA